MEAEEVTKHRASGNLANQTIRILAHPEGEHGYCNHYRFYVEDAPLAVVVFQDGPPGDVGVNGMTFEALLAILVDRLERYQLGPHRCRENALAITKLEEAVHWLGHRTTERQDRGVEGTTKP